MKIELHEVDGRIALSLYDSQKLFYDTIEVLKENNLSFHKTLKGHYNVWAGSPYQVVRALRKVHETVTELPFTEEYYESLLPDLGTKKFRVSLKEDLLRSPPMGEYQLEGIRRAIQQNRLMLAWEMGLGKTYAIVSALNHLWDSGMVDRILVVAPPESVYNFRREFLQFNTFGLEKSDFYIANPKNRNPFESEAKIVIMTYRSFLMLSDDAYKKKTGKISKKYRSKVLPIDGWGTKRAIILDESHNIGNLSARQTKVLHIHKDYFEFRYQLTGTPDPNGVNKFYSQIQFLDENLLGDDYLSWLRTIANLGNKWSMMAINYYYPDKVKLFLDKITPWVIREFTKDNLDLPDLMIDKIYVEMNDKQRDIYQALVSYVLSIVKEDHGFIEPRVVENKFPFIIQALDNPSLLKGKIDRGLSSSLHRKVESWKFKDHSKLEVVSSLINKYLEEGKKVILWSGHPKTMDELADYYHKFSPVVIHGQIDVPSGKSREEHKNDLLEAFKTDKDSKLLIASYYVLSTAVNIVEASRSIYFDRSFNATYWIQSQKRTHRIGQSDSVVINPIIIEDSLDERLDRALDRKEAMNNNLLSADSLSADQWKNLFLGKEDT